MQVPSKSELERFFDTEQAATVQFAETVGSWVSLRILDYLYRNEPATTGDIARDLNMDMRDVKDRLEALAEQDIVDERGGKWTTTTDEISITIARDRGLDITYMTGATDRITTGNDVSAADQSSDGVLSRVRNVVSSFFR
jgi:hypothetical protein